MTFIYTNTFKSQFYFTLIILALESDAELSLGRSTLVVGLALDGDHLLQESLHLAAVKLDGDQRRMISPLVALVGEGVDGKPLGFRKVGGSHHGFLVEIGFSLTVQEHLLSLSLSEIVEVVTCFHGAR